MSVDCLGNFNQLKHSQLQPAIEVDNALQSEAKADALEQVKILAEAGKNPQAESKRSVAQTALKVLQGKIDEIPGYLPSLELGKVYCLKLAIF